MRVIASLGLLTMLCGCGPIVYQVQQQMRGFQTAGSVDLSVHVIYGASPPPLLRTGVPNENPEVLTHSLLLSATHYTP